MTRKKLAISIGIGAVIGIVLASGIGVAKISLHGKFPSGTNIAGINISGKTPHEEEEVLRQKKEEYLKQAIKIKAFEETKELTPKELGVEILAKETILTIGEADARNCGLINILGSKLSGEKEHEPVATINFEILEKTIQQEFETEEKRPKNAKFVLEAGTGLEIKEEEAGMEIDKEKLARDLVEAAKTFSKEEIEAIATEKTAEITKELLEEQKEDLERALNQRTTIVDPVYRDDWYLRLRDNIDWVEFETKRETALPIFGNQEAPPSNYKVEIRVKEEKLEEYIEAHISRWLDREAEDVKIYKDEEGKVIIEGYGSDGKKIDRRMFQQALELAVNEGIPEMTVPVLKIKPEIDVSEDLKELGIKERLGIGHSSYYGSPWNRVHNIKVSADRFSGKLVAPGEVFSFNQNMGPVNAATGYRPELVIKPEGTVPEYGGGICQTSTTMYRAILFSGLPVVERHPHSYAVTYYSQVMGHGMDATIYLGGPDLKFKNDTEGHILIQAYVKENYELYFVFYGTSDGRSVEMTGPVLWNYRNPGPTIYKETTTLAPGQTRQVEKRHVGFRADWKRTITWPDGTEKEENINTNYRAIPARILVGAGKPESE